MGKTCNTQKVCAISVGSASERNFLKDPDADESTILKRNLKNNGAKGWTGFTRLTIWFSG